MKIVYLCEGIFVRVWVNVKVEDIFGNVVRLVFVCSMFESGF